MAKKSWADKLASTRKAEITILDRQMMSMAAGTRLLISTPRDVMNEIELIPHGDILTMVELRDRLAKRHQADTTCPLTTGIFTRIVAEVALEKIGSGATTSDVTPFWRVVDPKSPLAKKLSCGPDWVAAMRAQEQGSP